MKETLAKGMSATLALGLLAPGMAFAADADHTPAVTGDDVKVTAAEEGGSEGTTAVTWVADDSQLDITVPNTIHVVAKADGTLMVPTNAAITNNSVFAVHGTKYVTADAGITLVEDVAAEDGSKDVMEMQVTATGAAMQMGPAEEHAIAVGDLNLNKESVATLGLAGKVKLANDPATVPTDAFTVEWHFQAGLAKITEGTVQIDKNAFQSVLNDTVKHINFSATPISGGKDMEATGTVTAIQDGDTLNIMSAPGVTVALPTDSSELMSADNGGANLETITGDLDFTNVDSIKGICAGDTKVTDASAFGGNGTLDIGKTDVSGAFPDAPGLDPGLAEDWVLEDTANPPTIEPAVFNDGISNNAIPELVRPEEQINGKLLNKVRFQSVCQNSTTVNFLNWDDPKEIPQNATDISENQDQTLFAWTENTDSYVKSVGDESVIQMPKDCASLFVNFESLRTVTGTPYTAKVENFHQAFSFAKLNSYAFLENWDVSGAQYLMGMFANSNISDLSPLENWNVSNVEDFLEMFANTQNLASASGLGSWNLKSAKSLSGLFSNSAIADINALSNWNVSSVTNFSSMFRTCMNLYDVTPLKDWDVSSATTTASMFDMCSYLKDASALENWNLPSGCNKINMFYWQTSVKPSWA